VDRRSDSTVHHRSRDRPLHGEPASVPWLLGGRRLDWRGSSPTESSVTLPGQIIWDKMSQISPQELKIICCSVTDPAEPSEIFTEPGRDWRARAWEWLETGGKRVGIPALIVSTVALYFVVANYRLTVAANRPELASNGLRLPQERPPSVLVGFENVGKKIARGGTATLYSLDQADGTPALVETAPIIGAGSNVFAGYGGSAKFESAPIAPAPFFLVCATYFDDAGNQYLQALLFGHSTTNDPYQKELYYEEMSPPSPSRCNQQPCISVCPTSPASSISLMIGSMRPASAASRH
jgi:hypothetical protein